MVFFRNRIHDSLANLDPYFALTTISSEKVDDDNNVIDDDYSSIPFQAKVIYDVLSIFLTS